MLTGLDGESCRRISGCCSRGMELLAENSWERTGGVCSTLLMDLRVGESLGAWR